MSFPTWKTNTGNSFIFPNSILDGQVDVSGTFYNRTGNVIIGDSSNPDFDPSSNGITLNTTRICLGKDSSVTGDNGVAIGNSATTGLQENSISIGYNSIVDASNSVAIGPDASANGLNSIALGYNSGTGSYTNSVALGANSTVGANNVISLGDGTQNVGIGTTSPSEALSVNGNIGLVGSGNKYIRGGSANVSLESEYALEIKSDWNNNNENNPADIIFYTGDSERMRIQRVTGNVGIGTTNPTYTLDINAGTLGSNPNDKINYARFKSINSNLSYLDIYERRFSTGSGWGTAATRIQKMIDSTPMGYIEFNPPSNGGVLAFGTNQTQLMTIRNNGKVGIGTTNPDVPLHIATYTNQTIKGSNGNDSGYYNGVHGYISNTNYAGISAYNSSQSDYNPISIYTPAGYIASKGIYTSRGISFSSDRRIKSNISDINDDEALQKLRLFKPCKYTYIDYRENNTIPVYGFIAQEIKEVLPYAVDDTLNLDNEIPNIYRFCNITNDTILSFFDYDNSFDLSYNGKNYNFSDGSGNTSVFEKDLSGNICAIIFKSKNGVSLERKVINIIDENTFEIDCSFNETEILEDNTIFAYGQKVVNFNKLKKDAIWTVATAALQEVDRQQQADKLKIATLETQITNILARLDALENP
jgi:hypothetical protein